MMGSLVLNSDSFISVYDNVGEFISSANSWLSLILRISKQKNIIYKDLLLDDKEVVKGVRFKDIPNKIWEANIDIEKKRIFVIAFSKLSDDSSVYINYKSCTLFLNSISYNENTAFALAFLNNLTVLSILDNKSYHSYKIEVTNDEKNYLLYNVYDWKTYNIIRLINEEQNLVDYFKNHDLCIVSPSTNVDSFLDLSKNQKIIVADKLFAELSELVSPHHDLSYKRLKPLKSIIPAGKEYRLGLENKTAYRLYYFIFNGKIAILLDNIKKDEQITKQIKDRIISIHNTF